MRLKTLLLTCNAGQRFPGYVFGLGGPIVQHINVARLEEAVAAYRRL